MKKLEVLKRMLILLLVITCTIPSSSFAYNCTAPEGVNAKGTVSMGTGKESDPYVLVLGEPIIDIYYGKKKNYHIFFYFKSSKGGMSSANYIVENNPDKGRLRLKFQSNGEEAVRVSSNDGLRYFQAGAKSDVSLVKINVDGQLIERMMPTQLIDELVLEGASMVGDEIRLGGDTTGTVISKQIQQPYYEIRCREKVYLQMPESGYSNYYYHTYSLGNGYLLIDDNVYASNASTYATSYVFALHSLTPTTAYQYVTSEQISKQAKISFTQAKNADAKLPYVLAYFESPSTLQVVNRNNLEGKYEEMFDSPTSIVGTVETVYEFRGVNSKIHDAEQESDHPVAEVITKFLMSLADVAAHLLLQAGTPEKGYGNSLTIDALVFNQYPYTKIAFFDEDGEHIGINSVVMNVMRFWYNVFKFWASVLYVILLVYIGIKAMLFAGTPEQKKITGMLEGWIMGILLLVSVPVLIKYLIKLNDALVDVMRTNSKYSIYAYYSLWDIGLDFEEGEDSTTDVVDKLNSSIASLEARQDAIVVDIEATQEALQNARQKLAEFNKIKRKASQQVDDKFKDFVDYFNTKGLYLQKDGSDISADQIIQDCRDIVENYYNSHRLDYDEVYSDGSGLFIWPDDFMEGLEREIERYANKITCIRSDGSLAVGEDGSDISENVRKWMIPDLVYADKSIHYDDLMQQDGYDYNSILNLYEAQTDVMWEEEHIQSLQEELINNENTIHNYENAKKIIENGTPDIMGDMRAKTGKSYKIIYAVIWFILLFELILLLILYYKRFFVMAVLITIFPLVTIAYVFERSTNPRSSILKKWTEELILNVFIQSMHAVLYVALVETGYTVYMGVGDNWLLYVLAVVGLITSESVIKHILGLQGSTVSDLGKYGATLGRTAAATFAITKSLKDTGKDMENIDNNYKNKVASERKKDEEDDKKRDTLRTHEDNKIRQNGSLTEDEKKRRLEELKKQRAEKDKKTAQKRAKREQRRRREAYAKGVGRAVANATGAVATLAAGIAAGGDPEDFVKAGAAVSTIIGKGNSEKLSADAEKMIAQEKAIGNTSATVDSATVEPPPSNPPPTSNPNPSPYQSRTPFEYVPGSYGDPEIDEDTPRPQPKLKNLFSNELDQEQTGRRRLRTERRNWRIERTDTIEAPEQNKNNNNS